MSRKLRASLVGLLALVPLSSAAQRPPNVTGNWVLVSATTSGAGGRGEASNAGERPITSNTASGAAFNCGRECSIVLEGQTLTIDKALLAANQTAAPAVTLRLDGRQTPVVDSFNAGRQVPAAAKWNGDKLEILSSTGSSAYTQLLSIEAAQLVVVTSVNREGSAPVMLKYRRK